MKPIYLDNHATTPVDPEVFRAMEPYFCEKFGNSASKSHAYGWKACEAVQIARESIAKNIGAESPKTIIFTSGATETNNMVIKGIARTSKKKPVHIITQATEHKCILESCREIEQEGHEVTYLGVDHDGLVDPDDVKKAIRPNTLLCSVMYANNEIGVIQPIAEISKICHEKGIWLHSDAVQAVGKIPVDMKKDGIDLLSISAHKMYGPKGIGALYIARTNPPIRLSPLIHGGGHENGLRAGTLNVPAILGLAKALEICTAKMPEESKRLKGLRDYFVREITRRIDHTFLNGHPTRRLPHNANVSFAYVKDTDLIMALPELAVATGSACASDSTEPSYVLRALGVGEDRADSSIRFGLGRFTTKEEIDVALECIVKAVEKLRGRSLKYEMRK
ncbi:MAG: IscS subfamily cysteine desulfurase [Deltaproteobacteria bacterium]|nr:IscS subfamily cysteine desulfurase [Deltaproteobacteria bacterium]